MQTHFNPFDSSKDFVNLSPIFFSPIISPDTQSLIPEGHQPCLITKHEKYRKNFTKNKKIKSGRPLHNSGSVTVDTGLPGFLIYAADNMWMNSDGEKK